MSQTAARLVVSLTLASFTMTHAVSALAQYPTPPVPPPPPAETPVPVLSDPLPPAMLPQCYVPPPLPPAAQPAATTSPPLRVYAEKRPHIGLIAAGASMFGVFYTFTALAGAIQQDACKSCANGAWALYVPVVGPFIKLGSSSLQVERFGLVFDGLVQLGGAVMLISGLIVRQNKWVYSRSVQIAPTAGAGAAGLTVMGRF